MLVEVDDFKIDSSTSLLEILKMNAPEWPYICVAALGSMMMGCGMPIFAVLLGSILGVSIGKP